VEEKKRLRAVAEGTLAAPSSSASCRHSAGFVCLDYREDDQGRFRVRSLQLLAGRLQMDFRVFAMSTDFCRKRYNRCGLEGARLRTGGILIL
jgi:hypothetical protein